MAVLPVRVVPVRVVSAGGECGSFDAHSCARVGVDGVGELAEVGLVAGGTASGARRVGDGRVVLGEGPVEGLDEGRGRVVADRPGASDERSGAPAEECLGESAERRRPRGEPADVARVQEDERTRGRGIRRPDIGQVVAQLVVGVAGPRHLLLRAEAGQQELLRLRGRVVPAAVAGEVQEVEALVHEGGDAVGVVGIDRRRREALLEEPPFLGGVGEVQHLLRILGADIAHPAGFDVELGGVGGVVDPAGEAVRAEESRAAVVRDSGGRHEVHHLPWHVELAGGLHDEPLESVGSGIPEEFEHLTAEERARESHAEIAQAAQAVPGPVAAVADLGEL